MEFVVVIRYVKSLYAPSEYMILHAKFTNVSLQILQAARISAKPNQLHSRPPVAQISLVQDPIPSLRPIDQPIFFLAMRLYHCFNIFLVTIFQRQPFLPMCPPLQCSLLIVHYPRSVFLVS